MVALEGRILATPAVERDLKPIVDANANRESLLDLLARAVDPTTSLAVADRIRRKQQELRNVARQVRTVTSDAERVAKDPCS